MRIESQDFHRDPESPTELPQLRPVTPALLSTFGLNGKPKMSKANIAPGWLLTSPFLAPGTLGEANEKLQCVS